MFITIERSDLNEEAKNRVRVNLGWSAIDAENFAYLRETAGRTKYGMRSFVLVLVINPPASFTDLLQDYNDFERIISEIKAFTVADAIRIADLRLPRLQKQARPEEE